MRSSWLFRQRAAGRLSKKEQQVHPVAAVCTSPLLTFFPILAPDSLAILVCDLLNGLAVAYIATFTPLQAAFYSIFDTVPWHVANLICESLFIISVLLRFRRVGRISAAEHCA